MTLADITQLPSRGQRPLPHGHSGFCGCWRLPRATWPRPHLPALSTDPGASFAPHLGSTPSQAHRLECFFLRVCGAVQSLPRSSG